MDQTNFQNYGTAPSKPSKEMLEEVKRAMLGALSHDPNTDKKQASQYLEALKNSIHAWEIYDQLLQANESIEFSYLAANMLRQKIACNFNELPLECYSSLKDSIVNHLRNHEDYAVQGQLTLAIADLTLLLQAWQNPIEDLAKQLGLDVSLSSLSNTDFDTIHKALHNRLVFAHIIHQMCDLNHNNSERPLRIGARRREEYEFHLKSKRSQAISWWLSTFKELSELRAFMNDSSQSNQITNENQIAKKVKCIDVMDKLTGQIYLCYSAWLRIFDEENVNESLPLIDAAFQHLGASDCTDGVHRYAVEVVVTTASYCEDNSKVAYLINHIVSQTYTLEPAFKQSVASEDMQKSINFARCFTSVAETACHIHVIENQDFRLIELLLSCLSHYDYEVVEETYPFWWTFLEALQNRVKPSDYGPYIPYVNRFVMAITRLCQFDPDEETVVPEQDIHGFRANSADIIVSVLYITSNENFIRETNLLDNLALELASAPWEKTEAILYLISCVSSMMTNEEDNLRIEIFNRMICQQTNNQDIQGIMLTKQFEIKIGNKRGEVHPQIVATTLKIIGNMESFFADYPDYLVLAINYIISAISDGRHRSELIKPASSALCAIMESNANRHLSTCPQLLIIIKGLCSSPDQIDEHASSELLRCSAYLANAIEDTNLKDQFLCEIIRPIYSSMQHFLSQPKEDETVASKYLDRLSSVFRQANIHPSVVPELKNFVNLIDTELWPVIVKVLEVYASPRGHAIERTCRTIRYILRCIKPEWMIQRVAETMISLYKTYPQNSSPLYICSILVDEFANRSPEINQGLFAMLEIFCTLTFALLDMNAAQSKSLLTMRSYPETIDDMMRLFTRFLKKCPTEFVNCKSLESIIELSISSLRIDHQDANSNVSKFVTAFIGLGQQAEYAHIGTAIKNVLGARITDAVIRACLFDLPSALVHEEAQILMALYNFDKNLFTNWVNASVAALPKTNIQGIESVTSDQSEDFKKTITEAESMKRMVNCLRAFARLYS